MVTLQVDSCITRTLMFLCNINKTLKGTNVIRGVSLGQLLLPKLKTISAVNGFVRVMANLESQEIYYFSFQA